MKDTGLPSAARPAGTGTLDLALRVVGYLAAQSQPVALGQIAQAFDASKATVYRHLVTLQEHGFVRQDADTGRYEPGVRLLVLGEAVRERFDVATAARPEMRHLVEQTGQAVTICRVIDDRLIVLDLIHGRTIVEFGTRPGAELLPHATAHGKIWLAFGPDFYRRQVLSGPLERFTPSTIATPEALDAEIAAVRARGWAVAPDEIITAVNALAAPVFNHRNELVGSVAIVGATQFVPAAPADTLVREVVATGRRISERLGGSSQ